jgi:hypothetical protein
VVDQQQQIGGVILLTSLSPERDAQLSEALVGFTKEEVEDWLKSHRRVNQSWSSIRKIALDLFTDQGWISREQIDDLLKEVREDFPRQERKRMLDHIKDEVGELKYSNNIYRVEGHVPLDFAKEASIGDTIFTDQKAKEIGCTEIEIVEACRSHGWNHVGGKKMKKVKL